MIKCPRGVLLLMHIFINKFWSLNDEGTNWCLVAVYLNVQCLLTDKCLYASLSPIPVLFLAWERLFCLFWLVGEIMVGDLPLHFHNQLLRLAYEFDCINDSC